MKSLAGIMKADIFIPDFSSISKRSITLSRHLPSKAVNPGTLFIVDFNRSQGLCQRRMASGKRQDLCPLHLTQKLTMPYMSCPTAVPKLPT
jgi:hypothetical protein